MTIHIIIILGYLVENTTRTSKFDIPIISVNFVRNEYNLTRFKTNYYKIKLIGKSRQTKFYFNFLNVSKL